MPFGLWVSKELMSGYKTLEVSENISIDVSRLWLKPSDVLTKDGTEQLGVRGAPIRQDDASPAPMQSRAGIATAQGKEK
ncbi:sclerostin domain-containing protein 1 isoform X2 [Pantherophis guttatus]|uniref:Sclerostin domain-containing protein 1 isoform X2 n=1 Tax=Pantherophis guttatus TaxID=94885 RepID=A0ABM3YZW3_PANGU|nr:sclerostin domain-containing protein 1 isoform X2 [Pantherophis guttatus]